MKSVHLFFRNNIVICTNPPRKTSNWKKSAYSVVVKTTS
ncbi:hypothetical protein DYY66_0080 [Candidatus Nitrosotalea sp. FS]|nr:hypothetical protein [Candidatus Nitrosotalea sp. FS]